MVRVIGLQMEAWLGWGLAEGRCGLEVLWRLLMGGGKSGLGLWLGLIGLCKCSECRKRILGL